jgi:outer membrane protein OmpA-like peptidoglycan-associated protein
MELAATALFNAGQQALGNGRRVLLIDPLLDGASAMQSTQTRRMEASLAELVRRNHPQFELLPFTPANLARSPVVLVGTFTLVNNAGRSGEALDAYRICLALADLNTGKVMAKGTARALPAGMDTTPEPFYRDAPVWLKDPQVDAYIRTCQGTRAGDAIDAKYLDAMQVAALVSGASQLYAQRRYVEALSAYKSAAALPAGRQTRVLNGLYLSQWHLRRDREAELAFGELVDYGLSLRKLGMMFLFRPNSVELVTDPQWGTPYAMWVRQIAQRAVQSAACIEITGHASKGGPEVLNERLSLLRAQAVRDRIAAQAPLLAPRMIVNGLGSRATIVGSGANDFSDAPDRRVEFTSLACRA